MKYKLKDYLIRIDDQEQYSRRNSVRVNGIPKKRGETPDDVVDAVHREIHRLNLDVDATDVDRAHRFGSPYRDTYG